MPDIEKLAYVMTFVHKSLSWLVIYLCKKKIKTELSEKHSKIFKKYGFNIRLNGDFYKKIIVFRIGYKAKKLDYFL